MATLTNTKIKDTYDGLLKTTDNDIIDATGVTLIEDGLGNASAISIGRANNGVTITGALVASGLSYPTSDGTVAGQAIVTDAAGNLSFATVTAATPTLDQVTGAGDTSSRDIYVNGLTIGRGNGNSSSNTALGSNSLQSTTGINSTAVGAVALGANTSGGNNTAVGNASLLDNTTGSNNTALGLQSLENNLSGGQNTGIGTYAGDSITSGSNNVYVGYNADASASNVSNEIVIGANAIGNGSNSATYGDSNVTKHIFTGGNVGIGTSSPDNITSSGTILSISTAGGLTTNDLAGSLTFITNDGSYTGTYADGVTAEISSISESATGAAYGLAFSTGTITGTNRGERMRIDASGNVGIGLTPSMKFQVKSSGTSTEDVASFGNANISDGLVVTTNGNLDWGLNARNTRNLTFSTNQSERMRIQSNGQINLGDVAQAVPSALSATVRFIPAADTTVDLGFSTRRWEEVWAVNGTINTSDANEKQQIENLDEAELRVATRIKGLVKKFKWNTAVEKKGENARIHIGVIAQDVKEAFEAEGLDADRYSLFTSNTWWEKEIVEVDEQGVETTKIEIYEEFEEDATERTRLGVRYTELLAFVIAAL